MASPRAAADVRATGSGGAERLECGVFHRRFWWGAQDGCEIANALWHGEKRG